MFEWFWNTVDTVQGAPVERKLAETLGPDRIFDDPFPKLVNGESFQSGGCYFGVRLAGLHVVDARQFATNRYPLCVSLAEFKQRGIDRSVPFSIGPAEMLKRLNKAGVFGGDEARPAWIELRDLTIVPPTPVGVGNLSLFVGLYSVPGDNLVKTLLDVVGTLTQTASVAVPSLVAAGPAIDLTKAVYGALGTLTGSNLMRPLAQAENGRTLRETGSGYLVVANAPSDTVSTENLVVRGGKLCRNGQMVTDFDYCLVAIERHATILEEATGTAPDLFEPAWQEVLNGFNGGSADAAGTAMRALAIQIRGSQDLIDTDKAAVLAAYLAQFNQERDMLAQLDTTLKTGVVKGSGETLTGIMAKQAGHEQKANRAAVSKQLTLINERMNKAPKPARTAMPSMDGAAPILATAGQMRELISGEGSGDSGRLADALLSVAQQIG